MRRAGVLLALGLALATAGGGALAQPAAGKPRMAAPVVFFDIAGPDLKTQAGFYSKVFGWDIAPDGRFEVPVTKPLSATLRADPADKLIYLGVEDVTATLAKVTANGGSVIAPRFEVKGVVVLGLFKDPAGNSMGLVEMAGDKAKVP
jgi:predicted enzyme related to lactoylglutathione lyase